MQVNVHEAKSQLSRLIQCALDGEPVIIARNNRPVVRLEPIVPTPARRKLGALAGLVTSISDDFDAPLEDFKEYT